MGADVALLIATLALLVAVAVVAVLTLVRVWRQGDPGRRSAQLIRREVQSLERHFDNKVDLLLTHLAHQRSAGSDLAELVATLQRQDTWSHPSPAPYEARQEAPEPQPVALDDAPLPRPPGNDGSVSGDERLAQALGTADFLSTLWHQLEGPFPAAAGLVRKHLSRQGIAEPSVEPYPPLPRNNPKHWEFLVITSKEPGASGRRFLIPRNYSRYDPSVHNHLFKVWGRVQTLDNYIHELRQCAVLKPTGALEGFIEPELVERKGIILV